MRVFRSEQGQTSRGCAIGFFGLVGLLLSKWVYSFIPLESSLNKPFFRMDFVGINLSWVHVISGAVFCMFFIFGLFLANHPKVATFLIDTEAEVKKVSWSTRKELVSSTGVVIVATVFVAVFIGTADLVVSKIIHMLIHL
ncbi:MAG: preprotein translocase subunit SecE [Candidatus Auribacterota bacterium]|nr:preprotein translocase subunit SecE [Candidatus Auribacterota bacterium]